MITNEDKINLLIEKINTLEFIKNSYIEHAEEFKNKYILEDVLLDCNYKKTALLQELESLGGTWPVPLD